MNSFDCPESEAARGKTEPRRGSAFPKRLSARLLDLTDNTKAVSVIAHVLIVLEARRRPHRIRLASERAAAQHTLPAIARSPGRPIAWRAAVGFIPAVLHPLGRIAGRVIKAESVWP